MWFEVCVACCKCVLAFDVTDRVMLTITDKCLLSQLLYCLFWLLHYMLEGATLLTWSFVSFCSSSNCQPSAMAEHLGIEFMGMEQSILTLSPSIATK